MRSFLLTCAACTLVAGSANAAIVSFASGTAERSWTFTGTGPNVTNATGPNDYLTLHIDDDNGVLPRIDVSTRFSADYSLTYVGSLPLGGGAFSHNYLAAGTFSFEDVASGVTLLTVDFENALFTSRGGASSWLTTAALQGDNGLGASVQLNWNGANLPGYGLSQGASYFGGFGFDLTALNSSGAIPWGGQAPGRDLDPNHIPSGQWWSEASFSATTVPTPGGIALITLGGLIALRRRR